MIDNLAVCGQCGNRSIVILDALTDGSFIGACMYCDLPQEEDEFYIYQNHCWNCGFGIDSRFSVPSRISGMGYHCGRCGKDLTEWKLRRGLITASQLIKEGYNHAIIL